jgi:hypothetical protein
MISCGNCKHGAIDGCNQEASECLTQLPELELFRILDNMKYDYTLWTPITENEVKESAAEWFGRKKVELGITPAPVCFRCSNNGDIPCHECELEWDCEPFCDGCDYRPECDVDENGNQHEATAQVEPETKEVKLDVIDHPSHYAEADIPSGIECWDHYELAMSEEEFAGAMKNNIYKYIFRAGRKDPAKTIEDLEKAGAYLKRWIAYAKGERTVWMKGNKS